jgi:hypothetical protein
MARIVTLMGSGELAPTMVKVHRQILEQLGARPVPSVFLGTPFGFQENAEELSQRAVAYFDESLQTPLEVAGVPGAGGRVDEDRLVGAVQAARYVFSGPGSPTFALRTWRDSALARLLVEKLEHGGAVTFASAAALTLGAFTVPVYEIYKVGEDPYWLEGLDVLGAVGLHVAVVPHYNNAEGGTHDTHFCYLGERRLAELEQQLPEEVFVLGVDEHTAAVIDLDARRVRIEGLGVVTVRKRGRSVTFATGTECSIDDLLAAASGARVDTVSTVAADEPAPPPTPAASAAPLFDLIRAHEAAFDAAVAGGSAEGATAAVLDLERDLHDWSRDIPGQDELTRARAAIRSMVARLGALADGGLRDPRSVIGGYVELLIEQRRLARAERRFEAADSLRTELEALGIELRDSREGTEWVITGASGDAATPE